ncbi:MAG: hypothetical protein WBP93_12345 [Pyrinomonadaceae bacterium]
MQCFNRKFLSVFLLNLVFAIASLATVSLCLSSQANAQGRRAAAAGDDDPLFSNFKGVSIGMTADECRHKLGDPRDKGTEQDFYVFNEKQAVQVYYDKTGKVTAISIDFMGAGSEAPLPKSLFGSDLEAKPDGSMYKLVRYPKAGYWVSYNRTAGDGGLITVTMQKIGQ